MIKKVMYVCLMVAMMPFVSCDKDDDEVATIVGEWTQSHYVFERFEEGVSVSTKTVVMEDGEIEDFTFESDGTYSFYFKEFYNGVADEETSTGTYILEGDKIILSDSEEDGTFEWGYSLVEGQLIFTDFEEYVDNDVNKKTTWVTTFIRK